MKAIILAAGQGTRLYPYTKDLPKCMVKLAGKSLIDWQMRSLKAEGVTDITVVGGYHSDKITPTYTRMILNPRFSNTNMVETLFCAKEIMTSDEDLLICYGDLVYEPKIIHAMRYCKGDICISADQEWQKLWSMRMDDPLSDAETFKMDDEYHMIELGKKPKSYDEVQAQYMGLIKVSAEKMADFIDAYEKMDRSAMYDGKDFDNMFMTSFLQHLIDTRWTIKACLIQGGWFEIDTCQDLETYQNLVASNAEILTIKEKISPVEAWLKDIQKTLPHPQEETEFATEVFLKKIEITQAPQTEIIQILDRLCKKAEVVKILYTHYTKGLEKAISMTPIKPQYYEFLIGIYLHLADILGDPKFLNCALKMKDQHSLPITPLLSEQAIHLAKNWTSIK